MIRIYRACIFLIFCSYQPLHLLGPVTSGSDLTLPGYFLSRAARTNLLGVVAIQPMPKIIAAEVFVSIWKNFLRVISRLHRFLFCNRGNGHFLTGSGEW